MKRFLSLALMGALVLGAGSVAYANICAFDPAPAATLLFPFVAYNYDQGANGANTIFSITNVSSEAQIVHVTLWTDFSVAILDFNILLTGYDVQTMDIRTILAQGQLPVTTLANHDDAEGVNADGPISDSNQILLWNFQQLMADPQPTSALPATRCATTDAAYPGKYSTPIPQQILALFQGWLQSSQAQDRFHTNDCSKPFSGEFSLVPSPWWYDRTTADDTWMYITADVVETCNKTFPDEPSYWIPGTLGGEARYDNVLIGDVQWVNNAERFSEADNAVHLEADLDLGNVATIGPLGDPVSFYHRYSSLQLVDNDAREPLPTAWAFRYQGAGIDAIDTYIRAWKGSSAAPFIIDLEFTPANESPAEFIASNAHAYTYYAWDEDENVISTSQFPWSQPGGETVIPNLIPLETQEVLVDQLNTVDAFGWMLFVWPASNYVPGGPGAVAAAGCDFDLYQTWMGVKYVLEGDYSAFTTGAVMANFNCFGQQVLPGIGINFDYVDATGYVTSNVSLAP